jgi:hypothetical protein
MWNHICVFSAFVCGLLQQVVETGVESMHALRIQGGGSVFLCFLFPPLAFSARTQLSSHSHPHAAVHGLREKTTDSANICSTMHLKIIRA